MEIEVAMGTHLLDLVWVRGKFAERSMPGFIQWLDANKTKKPGLMPGFFVSAGFSLT